MPIPTHCWKNLLIDFVTKLPISTNWKDEMYNAILFIVNWLTNMVHHKSVKITINVPDLAEFILNVVIQHYGLSNSIVTN